MTEFFTENMVPWVIRDEREFTYKMEPFRQPTQEAVQARAEALRSEAQVLPAAPSRRDPGLAGFSNRPASIAAWVIRRSGIGAFGLIRRDHDDRSLRDGISRRAIPGTR